MGRVEPLLQRIAQEGWTDRLADRFAQKYGQDLRWQIVLNMERLGLIYTRVYPDDTGNVLSDKHLELYQNTYTDLWQELLNGMVGKYVRGKRGNRIHTRFTRYAGGTIKNYLISNAVELHIFPKTSPNKLIKAICNRKKEKTIKSKIALAKYRLEYKVKNYLLKSCPAEIFDEISSNRHHLADYFFEEYVPDHCSRVNRTSGKITEKLLGGFSREDYEQAVEFIGVIAPYGLLTQTNVDAPEGMSPDEYLDLLTRNQGSDLSDK